MGFVREKGFHLFQIGDDPRVETPVFHFAASSCFASTAFRRLTTSS